LFPEIEASYRQDLKTYEEENNMAYISSIEGDGEVRARAAEMLRFSLYDYIIGKAEGEAKGRVEGKAEGAFTLVSSLIRRQLGEIPEATSETIRGLSIAQLEQLALDLSEFKVIEDLANWLQRAAGK
jgi:Domain of unknown function (DUF4351)